MRKVIVGADSRGECIWFRKSFLFKDMQLVCAKVQHKLKRSGIDSYVCISVDDSTIALEVEISDKYFEVIGTVKYLCALETEADYCQLYWISTSPTNAEYTQAQWEEYSATINKLVRCAFSE